MLLASLLFALLISNPADSTVATTSGFVTRQPSFVNRQSSLVTRHSSLANPSDPLASGFLNPPDSARPHTWWHWMDGNVTKEGLTADLEAMKKVGIGGAQMFTVSQGIPPGPVGYMSDKWRQMTAHAVKEAGRLGIELCIHNCAGWSSSGGPWISPENAMQVIAWSEKKVQGPRRFDEVLPEAKAPRVHAKVAYYRDIAVYAFRTPAEMDVVKLDNAFLGRTGVIRMDGLQPDLSPSPVGLALRMSDLLDLSDKLDQDGRLSWDVPSGSWTILRMGHVPTGKDNHPAPPEGDGLEVDKLSREALDAHWAGMMAKVISDVGPLAGKVLNNSLIDSYEVGSQNWTPRFREEFQRRRGYDCLPWLPTITGLIVDSKEKTERFLWDFRRTIADLFADNYFRFFGELCHKAGMMFSTEPYGNGGFDNIQAGGTSDIPMGEFWSGSGGAIETTKLAASVGHVYGRPVIGAEAFTADEQQGRWLVDPYSIKVLGDEVFCNGVNRYIFHRYAHQPWMNLYPGMTMGPWGMHLERTVTWWSEASTWLKYVARCQYLLQKGNFVADALYYYGEGAPVDLPYRPNLNPKIPAGYDYDGCDASVVMNRLSVRNGRLVLPDGMSYRVLVLPDSCFMSLGVAQKIRELIRNGATVLGTKPTHSPSLAEFPLGEQEMQGIAHEIWGTVREDAGERTVGRGRIVWGKPLGDVLAGLGVGPDFQVIGKSFGAKTAYIHRKIGAADVYFVSNQRYEPAQIELAFRVTGKAPELWHPDTGRIEAAPIFRQEKGRTILPLMFDPAGSVFVVFRKPAPNRHWTSFQGPATRKAQPATPKITIRLARYEAPDGKRGADVTDKVRQMVEDGQLEIPASNGVFGDPVPNVVKQLRIEYEIDGKPMTKVVPENQVLALVARASLPASRPQFDMALGADGSLFVTPWVSGSFVAKSSKGSQHGLIVKDSPETIPLVGPWLLKFPPNWGAPAAVSLSKLISWSEHPNRGVKYFSGTATYFKEFDLPASMLSSKTANRQPRTANRFLLLDLGRVKNFARVRLNGKLLAVLWKEPFSVDISGAARLGRNRLEIEVTNLWPNRIIGDEQLPPDVEWNGTQLKGWPEWLVKGEPRPKTGRLTFTTWRFFNKDSKLLESGLLGPVTIRSAQRIKIPANRTTRLIGKPPESVKKTERATGPRREGRSGNKRPAPRSRSQQAFIPLLGRAFSEDAD